MLCLCIGLFLLVIAGFLIWAIFNPQRSPLRMGVGKGSSVNVQASADFLDIQSSNALKASADVPVFLYMQGCGYCTQAKSSMREAKTHQNVLTASATQEHFQAVAGMGGVPALIKDGALVHVGAGPALLQAVADSSPKAAAKAYEKYK
jgi:hypothetical protein